MIILKTEAQIAIMRQAGAIAATVLHRMAEQVAPGVTTYDLDQFAKQLIESMGAVSACYGYRIGKRTFPAYTCISINDEVVHGIGSPDRRIQPGDIVSLDVSVVYEGYVGDNAKTVVVQPALQAHTHLVEATERALTLAIDQARPGNHVGHIGHAVQTFVEAQGFSVVRDCVGHGVGQGLHEDPQIPNYVASKFAIRKTPRLRPGMTIAIEPMVNLGTYAVEYATDGWTICTADRQPSAHFEHTILITEADPEILTLPRL